MTNASMKHTLALLMTTCAVATAHAQDIIITSFSGNGTLSWSNSATTGYQSIEWAPSLTKPWHTLTSSICTAQQYTAEVPMFYRVKWSPGYSAANLAGTWLDPWTFDTNGTLTAFDWARFGGPTPHTLGGQLSVSPFGEVDGTVTTVHTSAYGDETTYWTWNGQLTSSTSMLFQISAVWANPGGADSGSYGTVFTGGYSSNDLAGTWSEVWTFDTNGTLTAFDWASFGGPTPHTVGGQLSVSPFGHVNGTVTSIHNTAYGDETTYWTWYGEFTSPTSLSARISAVWANPGGADSGSYGTVFSGTLTK